ncbi:transcriptional activator of glycolytic enzymes-domain-containing protein [Dipodascopsis tothii]|uniref:transcriptional activator of glycolytic enzymes-domain-containing protein n=1 Tax=Dipodascopsis tothii TaxID=44089 RepID=UPI0034CE3703
MGTVTVPSMGDGVTSNVAVLAGTDGVVGVHGFPNMSDLVSNAIINGQTLPPSTTSSTSTTSSSTTATTPISTPTMTPRRPGPIRHLPSAQAVPQQPDQQPGKPPPPRSLVHDRRFKEMRTATVPQYRMSRSTVTVQDLWKEWENGLNGGPSVRTLEETYGTGWRNHSAERKFFCLRKVIIDYVQKVASADNVDVEIAVDRVEQIRKDNQFTSLQRLAEHIKRARRGEIAL